VSGIFVNNPIKLVVQFQKVALFYLLNQVSPGNFSLLSYSVTFPKLRQFALLLLSNMTCITPRFQVEGHFEVSCGY